MSDNIIEDDPRCFLATNDNTAGLERMGAIVVLAGEIPHKETWATSYDEILRNRLDEREYQPMYDYLVVAGPKSASSGLLAAAGAGRHLLLIFDNRTKSFEVKMVVLG